MERRIPDSPKSSEKEKEPHVRPHPAGQPMFRPITRHIGWSSIARRPIEFILVLGLLHHVTSPLHETAQRAIDNPSEACVAPVSL